MKSSFHHYLKKNPWKDYTVNKTLNTNISDIDQFINAIRSECAVIIFPKNSIVSKSEAISLIEKSKVYLILLVMLKRKMTEKISLNYLIQLLGIKAVCGRQRGSFTSGR